MSLLYERVCSSQCLVVRLCHGDKTHPLSTVVCVFKEDYNYGEALREVPRLPTSHTDFGRGERGDIVGVTPFPS